MTILKWNRFQIALFKHANRKEKYNEHLKVIHFVNVWRGEKKKKNILCRLNQTKDE